MNNLNLIHDIEDVTTESGLPQEPVTLQEMKDYLRLEGFVDVDESTTESLSDFDLDDTLIGNLITAARRKVELYLGVSLVFHSWKVEVTNGCGGLELPYGPVQSITSVKYSDGTAVDSNSQVFRGFGFKSLSEPYGEYLVIEYDAGYEDCPEGLRLAIKQIVAHWYDNRADGNFPPLAYQTMMGYKRAWTWLG